MLGVKRGGSMMTMVRGDHLIVSGSGYMRGIEVLPLQCKGASAVDDEPPAAQHLELAAYPNPFNPTITIAFELPHAMEVSLEIFDQTFVITDVLYWLALGVAFVGILGAMLALQLERAREFATLRALGMTPGQVGGMVAVQTGVMGILSGLAAIPLGVIMAWVLIKVINRRAFGWQIEMTVAADILLSALVFATLASLLAGLYPAWRAAQSRPAIVMREE